MRLAIVQLRIDPKNRARTLQSALRAIDAAAETDPAPDLVVLPAFAGVSYAASGRAEFIERLHGQTTAACGFHARNWGIFLALGMAEQGSVKPFLTAVLIDRDGDIRLGQRQVSCANAERSEFAAGDGWRTVDVLLGRIGLLVGDDLLSTEAWSALAGAGAEVIVGSVYWQAKSPAQTQALCTQLSELSRQHGLWCAAADVTPDPASETRTSGHSQILDGAGRMVASAEPGRPAILWADVPPGGACVGSAQIAAPPGGSA